MTGANLTTLFLSLHRRKGRPSPLPLPLAGEDKKKMSVVTAFNSANRYGMFLVERTARARAATSAISEPILG